MNLLQPFRAWRPAPGLERRVAAPPYDVLNSAEARSLAGDNPESFLHVSKAEIDLEPGVSPCDERVYATASARFVAMRRQGILRQEATPCYYLYRLEMDGHRQTGIAATASVAAYRDERIKKHEFTRPDKEDDRTRLAATLEAHTGPVFLIYPDDLRCARLIEALTSTPPACDFMADDGVRHTLWVVAAPETLRELTEAFDRVPALYIADGHHRAAAASRVSETRPGADRFLAVAFPNSQVRIMDYNRVVRDLNGLDETTFLRRVGERFRLTPAPTPVRPEQRHLFGMYLRGRWYDLRAIVEPAQEADPVARLDVTILQERLLDPLLGITNPRQDTRIDFVGGRRGLDELMRRVDSQEMTVAFSLFPTTMQELMAVADAGHVMPPKSTWFEPKLRDGLVLQTLSEE
ncbi:MAG: DUF1015 domain-containing protein [Magnetococcales bacterium]|nr:DUF1015 domain-containing protein [Magnetococcales bacterium]